MPVVEKIILESYRCETCGKEHNSLEKAEKCEDSHKCYCQKSPKYSSQLIQLSTSYESIGNGDREYTKTLLDYRDGRIISVIYNDRGDLNIVWKDIENRRFKPSVLYSKVKCKVIAELNYCPDCGRKFNKSREQGV